MLVKTLAPPTAIVFLRPAGACLGMLKYLQGQMDKLTYSEEW